MSALWELVDDHDILVDRKQLVADRREVGSQRIEEQR